MDDVEQQSVPMPRSCFEVSPMTTIKLLIAANLFNYLDRGIIPGAPDEFGGFILDTLDVHDSSFYIGILGSAFIASFSVCVVVFGHAVHHYKPFEIVGVGFAVWLTAVFLSGLARYANSFTMLICGRALSGVGEAALQAIAPTFITDFAPAESKRTWLGIYLSMVVIGTASGIPTPSKA